MNGPLPHLKFLRHELIATMAASVENEDGGWHLWLALLSQAQGAIAACEAVTREVADDGPEA